MLAKPAAWLRLVRVNNTAPRRDTLQLLAKPAAQHGLSLVCRMGTRKRTLLLLAKPAAQERPYPVDNKGSW